MSEVIFISNARLSFPHIVEPQRNVNEVTGKERISYNCELILPADHAGFKQFMARYAVMAGEKWKEHANQVMQMIHNDRKSRCYGQGTEKVNKKTFKPYDGYDGMVYITCGRDTQPQIIQADGTPIDPANTMAYQQITRKMYGGCRVNAAVKPWLQENTHGRGVRCDLVALQFAADDTPFGEDVVDASGMFGAVAAPAAGQPTPGGMPWMTPAPTQPAAPAPLPPFMFGR